MRVKVRTVGVRDSKPSEHFLKNGDEYDSPDLFDSTEDVKYRVPKLLKGLDSIYSVRVVDADDPDTEVMIGHRAGMNGTGNAWTWRAA